MLATYIFVRMTAWVCKCHLCATQMVLSHSQWTKTLLVDGLWVGVISMNFKKKFDQEPHHICLQKLLANWIVPKFYKASAKII